jgi:hypothetical protein
MISHTGSKTRKRDKILSKILKFNTEKLEVTQNRESDVLSSCLRPRYRADDKSREREG